MTPRSKNRPILFIGSSSQGLPIADALQEGLVSTFEVEIWNQGTFGLTQANINNLIKAGKRFDFAVLVLTPDDLITTSTGTSALPRDNVILEIGFFLGVLGQERTFIVHDATANLKLPSDLAGVSCATYYPPTHGSFTAALGSVCTGIKNATKAIPFGPVGNEERVKDMVESALNIVSNALSSPLSIYSLKLRAFIFKKEETTLVCTHFWAPFKVREAVNVLRFDIDSETANQVAVVKAALEKRVVAVAVSPLPETLDGIQGEVEEDLCFVLAAPILGPKGEVWGTVDLDASSPKGKQLLRQEMSKNVIFELGRHLYMILTNDMST